MKVVLAEPKFLKEPLFIIGDLVNEVTLKFTKEKLGIIAMDPANVAMIIFNLLSTCFVDYNVEKDIELGVNLDSIKQVLRRIKPSDTLMMELKDNRLKITLKSDNTRTFNIPLINLEDQKQDIPKLEFSSKIEMPSSLFEEAIADIEVVSDALDIKLDENRLTLESTDAINHALVELNPSEDILITSKDKKTRSRYSIDYLKKISKGGKLSDNVVLNFSNDYPLRADYKITDKLSLSMILAPRVINE